jgi:asparagine synthase (glutamine-hydrolysing)
VTLQDREVLDAMDSHLWAMDEPYMLPTVYGYWKVVELARHIGAKVMLDGRGGDECFCGHSYLHPCMLYNLVRSGHLLRSLSEIRWRQRRWGVPVRRTLVDLAKFVVPNRYRGRKLPPWLARDLPVARRRLPKRSLRSRQLDMLFARPSPAFQHHYDRNTLSLGLDSRSPFLDPNVVECALALKPSDLLRKGFMKWALRDAMRGIIPPERLDQAQKQGFGVDLREWFAEGGLGDTFAETFRSPRAASRPYFDSAQLLTIVEEQRTGRPSRPLSEVWRAFIVERWLRLFIDPPQLEPPPPHPSTPTSSVSAAAHLFRPALGPRVTVRETSGTGVKS